MNNPINAMCRTFGLTPMEAYLLLTVPRFEINAARGGTTFRRDTVERDLRDSISIAEDDDRTETLALINRLILLPITQIAWYSLGVRSMIPQGEIIPRPGSAEGTVA